MRMDWVAAPFDSRSPGRVLNRNPACSIRPHWRTTARWSNTCVRCTSNPSSHCAISSGRNTSKIAAGFGGVNDLKIGGVLLAALGATLALSGYRIFAKRYAA